MMRVPIAGSLQTAYLAVGVCSLLLLLLLTVARASPSQSPHENGMDTVISVYKEAHASYERGDLARAERGFKQLIKLAPELSVGYLSLAIVYEKGNKRKKAFATFVEARKKYPRDFDLALAFCRFGAAILNTKALSSSVLESSEPILKACQDAAEINDKDVEAVSMYGNILVLLMRFAEAAPFLEKAVKMSKSDEAMHFKHLTNLILCNLRGGFVHEVTRHLDTLVHQHGHRPEIHHLIGSTRSIYLSYDEVSVRELTLGLQTAVERYRLKDRLLCPSGKWRVAMNWTDAPAHLVSQRVLNPSTVGSVYSSSPVHIFPETAELDPYYTAYHERAIFLVTMTSAVFSRSMGMLTAKCIFFPAAQTWNAELDDPSSIDQEFFTVKEISHPVATTLPLKNINNYYHWLVEGLLRLVYLGEEVLSKKPGTKILVPPKSNKFVGASLQLLGIADEDVIYYQAENNERWHFTQDVHLIDWIPPSEDSIGSLLKDPWSSFSPPREGLRKLRQRLLSALIEQGLWDPDAAVNQSNAVVVGGRILFVSRDPALAVRSIANENAVIRALRKEFGQKSVEVHTGKEPLHEQLVKFANADVVIGAHGAGLANLVMCKENSTLILFPMKPHVDRSFGHLAAAMGMHQWVVSDVTSYYYGTYGTLTKKQINSILSTAKMVFGIDEEDASSPVAIGTRPASEGGFDGSFYPLPADFGKTVNKGRGKSKKGKKAQASKKTKTAKRQRKRRRRRTKQTAQEDTPTIKKDSQSL